MAQKGPSGFLEVSHLDSTFFLEVLSIVLKQAWQNYWVLQYRFPYGPVSKASYPSSVIATCQPWVPANLTDALASAPQGQRMAWVGVVMGMGLESFL